MTYDDFCNQINEYIEVYNEGLKKQANTPIKSVIDFLDNLESSKLDAIFHRFLSEYCDDSIWDSLSERGNGDILFTLKNRIKRHFVSVMESLVCRAGDSRLNLANYSG